MWLTITHYSIIIEKNGENAMKTEYVLVETVEMFKIRYVIEVPEGKEEWALDTVVMNEGVQFSQKYIDENIIGHRVISKEEALRLCDEDNDYTADWPEELKVKTFFTPPFED